MSNGAKRGLAAAAVLFMMATAASRVLGLVREQVMLYYLGLGAEMGAFTVAFKVPSLIRTLVADTALSAAFIPCLLYTSDAADDLLCVDLGGRRIITTTTQTPKATSSTVYF